MYSSKTEQLINVCVTLPISPNLVETLRKEHSFLVIACYISKPLVKANRKRGRRGKGERGPDRVRDNHCISSKYGMTSFKKKLR